MRFYTFLLTGLFIALFSGQIFAQTQYICDTRNGAADRGLAYTHWNRDTDACLNLHGTNELSYYYDDRGSVVGGRGWRPGTRGTIFKYQLKDFRRTENSGLAWATVYGWMERRGLSQNRWDRRIEFYIIENWIGPYPYSYDDDKEVIGRYTVTGEGTYNLYRKYRNDVNAYANNGVASGFVQYVAVRTTKRPGYNRQGRLNTHTISMLKHFKHWNERCLRLGTFNRYLVMGFEAYDTKLAARMRVWGGGNVKGGVGRACSKSADGEEGLVEVIEPADLTDRVFAPSAYPNPARTDVTVDGLLDGDTVIDIYNAAGQRLAHHEFTAEGGQTGFDISSYKPGIYIFSVIQDEQRKVLRISKQ